MRDLSSYPVTLNEVIRYFELEKTRLEKEIQTNFICGDMRPLYYEEALKWMYKERTQAERWNV